MRSLLFVFLLSFSPGLFAQKQLDQNADCLVVIATFNNTKNIDDIWAYQYLGNKKIDSVKTSTQKGFSFAFKPNKIYSIVISKPGYYDRLVSITTALPPGVFPNPIFTFGFKTEFIAQKYDVDTYWLDFPIARVAYDTASKNFNYNKKYTQSIKQELFKLDLLKETKK